MMSLISRLFWKSIPKPERMLLLSLVNEPNRQIIDKTLTQKHSFPSHFDQYQCIFIHTPKVAGISLVDALGFADSHSWHLPLKYYEATEQDKFNQYFKFGFVRNPWDRLFSAYQFLKQGGVSNKDQSMSQLINHYSDFNDFVAKWLNEDSITSMIHLAPMYRFFENQHGHIAADFIGRYENLQQDYEVIRKRIGTGKTLPHKNASTKNDYKVQFSTKTIDKIALLYERDIVEFNYDFE